MKKITTVLFVMILLLLFSGKSSAQSAETPTPECQYYKTVHGDLCITVITETPQPGTGTPMVTDTETATMPATNTPTPTNTATRTQTPTATATQTRVPTRTPTATFTPSPTKVPTITPTNGPTPVSGSTIYVAAGGNDKNFGTIDSPFATISHALSVSATGSTIFVGTGKYAQFSFSNRTIECIPARTCIAPNTISLNGNATLRGFVVDGAYQHASIELYVGNNLAENNEVRNGVQCLAGTSPGNGCPGSADADGFRFFGPNNVMRGNYIHDITYNNPLNDDPTNPPHIDCFQTWADSSSHIPAVNTIIEFNICDNFSTVAKEGTQGMNLENAVGTIVRNNYFHTYGKKIMTDSGNSNTTVQNNIFIGGPVNSVNPNQYGIFNNDGSAVYVKNNIFWDINGGSTPYIFNVPAANQSGNLLKVNPLMGDGYHPALGSPACTAGTGGGYVGALPCQ